jgi:hypothetical protein
VWFCPKAFLVVLQFCFQTISFCTSLAQIDMLISLAVPFLLFFAFFIELHVFFAKCRLSCCFRWHFLMVSLNLCEIFRYYSIATHDRNFTLSSIHLYIAVPKLKCFHLL